MFKKIVVLLCFLGMSMPRLCADEVNVGNWNVIPLPKQLNETKSSHYVLENGRTVRVADVEGAEADDMLRNAQMLIAAVDDAVSIRLKQSDKKRGGEILLAIDASMADEQYSISANSKGIKLCGGSAKAVFYGIQTIIKALPTACGASKVKLPAVEISDSPRFAYRGFMVDVSRHFFGVDYIKRVIDVLALHNINYFHWHLTDDQGWRLEIKKYPQLTKVGSWRKESITEAGGDTFDGTPVSGFYTQDEAREIVRYAAERYIKVIPEIDLPGHMLAALASYPELGCTGGEYEVATRYGVFDDVLCGGNEATLQFAKDVLGEVMDIFPSEYIHIGGDECPKKRWKECPKCQAKIAELGLTDTPGHSKENQLQTWMMGELEKVINSRGRKMMGWDEILEGHPTKTATVLAWTSVDASIRAAREGHNTIVCPISNFYFSNRHWNKVSGVESLKRVYNLDPVSDVLNAEESSRIVGAEGCIWTEWVKDGEKMEWQMMPRLAALCEVQWTARESRNLDSFLRRLSHMQKIYEARGYRYRTDLLVE
ncbi:MAG: beta-N-acetylhexosaminidase [Muribaculaceae bacterium]